LFIHADCHARHDDCCCDRHRFRQRGLFAFSPLLPEAASSVGIPTLALAVPVQLSAGIARTMSPIAGDIIAVSGITGLTPIALIRRTIPVMIIAVIVSVTSSLIFL